MYTFFLFRKRLMKLYSSGENDLKAIYILHKERGMLRSVDAATYMGVSKPSAVMLSNHFKTAAWSILIYGIICGRNTIGLFYGYAA